MSKSITITQRVEAAIAGTYQKFGFAIVPNMAKAIVERLCTEVDLEGLDSLQALSEEGAVDDLPGRLYDILKGHGQNSAGSRPIRIRIRAEEGQLPTGLDFHVSTNGAFQKGIIAIEDGNLIFDSRQFLGSMDVEALTAFTVESSRRCGLPSGFTALVRFRTNLFGEGWMISGYEDVEALLPEGRLIGISNFAIAIDGNNHILAAANLTMPVKDGEPDLDGVFLEEEASLDYLIRSGSTDREITKTHLVLMNFIQEQSEKAQGSTT